MKAGHAHLIRSTGDERGDSPIWSGAPEMKAETRPSGLSPLPLSLHLLLILVINSGMEGKQPRQNKVMIEMQFNYANSLDTFLSLCILATKELVQAYSIPLSAEEGYV